MPEHFQCLDHTEALGEQSAFFLLLVVIVFLFVKEDAIVILLEIDPLSLLDPLTQERGECSSIADYLDAKPQIFQSFTLFFRGHVTEFFAAKAYVRHVTTICVLTG